jgi:hypothetical protein
VANFLNNRAAITVYYNGLQTKWRNIMITLLWSSSISPINFLKLSHDSFPHTSNLLIIRFHQLILFYTSSATDYIFGRLGAHIRLLQICSLTFSKIIRNIFNHLHIFISNPLTYLLWEWLWIVLKIGNLEKEIKNTLNVLKRRAVEWRRRSFGLMA